MSAWHAWEPVPGEPPVRRIERLLHWTRILFERAARESMDLAPLAVGPHHVLHGDGVRIELAAPGWGQGGDVGFPQAVVWHYTATRAGTAAAMHRRRNRPYDPDGDVPATVWHVTIETNGVIYQMLPLNRGGWHATSGNPGDRPIHVGSQRHAPNHIALGVELVGYGESFPEAQVRGAMRLLRALARRYDIRRAHAGISHSDVNPRRRIDPGPVWEEECLPSVLGYAYPLG